MFHEYPEEETARVREFIIAAIVLLLEHDEELLLKGVHENSINHRLAHYLELLMPAFGIEGYACDTEYDRYLGGLKKVKSIQTGKNTTVRPDVLIHKRSKITEDLPHLLVIEAKKLKTSEHDRNKVQDLMADNRYQYKFGLLTSYYKNLETVVCELLIFVNGKFECSTFPAGTRQNKAAAL